MYHPSFETPETYLIVCTDSVGKTSRRLLVAWLVATNLTFAQPELVVNFERLELVASNISRRLLYAD